MRILYLSVRYPLPQDQGSKMRLWSTLGALAKAGHEVALITLATPAEIAAAPPDQLAAVCNDTVIVCKDIEHFTGSSNYLGRLTSILSPLPYSARRYLSLETKEAVRKKLLTERFDVVFCEHVFSAMNLPECQLPVLISTHNVESRILDLYSEAEPNPLKSLYARWEALRMKRFEANCFRRGSIGIACSKDDAQQINTLCPQLPMFVVPNVVDIHAYLASDKEDPATIVYVGDMHWYPNCDALRHFVREILPQVQKEVPELRVVAAGRNPSAQFRAEFAGVDALSFTGTMADLRPVLGQATVAVVPLRIGSGTRIKILEFGAMGKAMVSSTLGAQGLDFVPEKEILLADTPSEFARQVIRLLRSPELRQMLGSAARRRVQQDYCFKILDRSLANALDALSGDLSCSS